MACTLFARGRSFDVDRFVGSTNLTYWRVWTRGEDIPRPTIKRRPRRHTHSGLSLDISTAGFDEFDRQLRNAVTSFTRQAKMLARLRNCPGVEEVWVEFGIRWRHDVAIQSDYLPPQFVRAAGTLLVGVTLSHHPLPKQRSVRKRT